MDHRPYGHTTSRLTQEQRSKRSAHIWNIVSERHMVHRAPKGGSGHHENRSWRTPVESSPLLDDDLIIAEKKGRDIRAIVLMDNCYIVSPKSGKVGGHPKSRLCRQRLFRPPQKFEGTADSSSLRTARLSCLHSEVRGFELLKKGARHFSVRPCGQSHDRLAQELKEQKIGGQPRLRHF